MSNYQSEYGVIKVPAADFARIRKAVQDAQTNRAETIFNYTQQIWAGLSRKEKTDPKSYDEGQERIFRKMHDDIQRSGGPVNVQVGGKTHTVSRQYASEMLDAASWMTDFRSGHGLSRVKKTELEWPTNRTTSFSEEDAHLSFNRDTNEITWNVSENNHAVDQARGSGLWSALSSELARTKWTRDTGGVITYTDEYKRDAHVPESPTIAFGPIGAAEAPNMCEPYMDSQGRRVTRNDLTNAYVNRFQPRGHNGHAGQFTYKGFGESNVRL